MYNFFLLPFFTSPILNSNKNIGQDIDRRIAYVAYHCIKDLQGVPNPTPIRN